MNTKRHSIPTQHNLMASDPHSTASIGVSRSLPCPNEQQPLTAPATWRCCTRDIAEHNLTASQLHRSSNGKDRPPPHLARSVALPFGAADDTMVSDRFDTSSVHADLLVDKAALGLVFPCQCNSTSAPHPTICLPLTLLHNHSSLQRR